MRLLLYVASFLLKFEIYENIHTRYFENLIKIPCLVLFLFLLSVELEIYIVRGSASQYLALPARLPACLSSS
jgi:hypothetical protein